MNLLLWHGQAPLGRHHQRCSGDRTFCQVAVHSDFGFSVSVFSVPVFSVPVFSSIFHALSNHRGNRDGHSGDGIGVLFLRRIRLERSVDDPARIGLRFDDFCGDSSLQLFP